MTMKLEYTSTLSKAFKRRNFSKLTKTLHGRMIRLWRESVAAFINEVVQHIHVDTGMSMASLQPLAAQVRFKTIITEMLRGYGPKPGHQNAYGAFVDNNAKFKSKSLGASLGKRAYHLSFGTPQSPQLQFDFEIVVLQYFIWEDQWQSLEKGKEAFINYFNDNLLRHLDVRIIRDWLLTGNLPLVTSGEVI